MSDRTIGILGLGIFGSSVLTALAKQDMNIIAIDDHAETGTEERVFDLLHLALKGKDTFTARDLGQLDKELQKRSLLMNRRLFERHADQLRERLQLIHLERDEQA